MIARLLYSLVLYILMPLVVVYLYFFRGRKNPQYRQHFLERFGFTKAKGDIIVHCASVGEVLATAPLLKALVQKSADARLVISCNTPTGRTQIQSLFSKEIAAGHVHCTYLPFDLPLAQRRFIRRTGAQQLTVVETELWPNLFYHAKKQGLSTLVVNARLSAKSAKGYQRFAPLTRVILNNIDVLACHHQADAERFLALGLNAKKVSVTGSIKFDINIDKQRQAAKELRKQLGDRPIWIAGSTHPGEPEILLEAHKAVLKTFSNALLIIAPRHPEQFPVVADYLTQQSWSFCQRSLGDYHQQQVLLADTLGELVTLYGAADVAFIGGSLIERGGHNPLEASAHGMAVLTGKHTFNFDHVYPELISQGGAILVNEQNLASTVTELLAANEKRQYIANAGLNVVKANQGAVEKTCALMLSKVEGAQYESL